MMRSKRFLLFEQALYDRMADEMILEYGEGQDIDAVNAAALSNKLQQMANGAVYDESGNVRNIHDRKLDALEAAFFVKVQKTEIRKAERGEHGINWYLCGTAHKRSQHDRHISVTLG